MDTRFRLKFYLIVFFVIIAFGTLAFEYIEGLSLLDAFYFIIVTIATVGYGDIHPLTPAGTRPETPCR
ncbi:MAG: potassium channel family protein [Dissulfuribacterales bacterium]